MIESLPLPAMDEPGLSLLLAALKDALIHRRIAGRLRPRVVGGPYPRRRLARLQLPGMGRSGRLRG